MKVFTLIEFILIVFLIFVVITQIIIPGIRGTRMFPLVRREAKIKDELLQQNQEQYETELSDAVEQRRREWYGTTTKEETDLAEARAKAALRKAARKDSE